MLLVGEAFNVSPSFFQSKKYKTLLKLRDCSDPEAIRIILCNNDAVSDSYSPQLREHEAFLVVDLSDAFV